MYGARLSTLKWGGDRKSDQSTHGYFDVVTVKQAAEVAGGRDRVSRTMTGSEMAEIRPSGRGYENIERYFQRPKPIQANCAPDLASVSP